jgi:hypothetical protein
VKVRPKFILLYSLFKTTITNLLTSSAVFKVGTGENLFLPGDVRKIELIIENIIKTIRRYDYPLR